MSRTYVDILDRHRRYRVLARDYAEAVEDNEPVGRILEAFFTAVGRRLWGRRSQGTTGRLDSYADTASSFPRTYELTCYGPQDREDGCHVFATTWLTINDADIERVRWAFGGRP